MNRYVVILLGSLSQPLFAATNVVYLDAGANIPAVVTQFGTDGGTIYLAEGSYQVGAGSGNGNLLIDQAPVTLVGSVDSSGAPATTIELIPDSTISSQDAAIKIVDDVAGNDSISDLAGSNSEIRNIKITVNAGANETSAGGIEIDGGEFVVIENVIVEGFGDDVRDVAYEALDVSPFAIKIHTSAVANTSTFDCADWLKINNTKLTNNYRGFVATGCSNGYVTNTLIEDTGPGAAVYIERKGTNGGSTFKFLGSTIQEKILGSGAPADKDYLVYLTHCTNPDPNPELECNNANLRNTNASFLDTTSQTTAKHFYVNSGQNQWFNHNFVNGSNVITSMMTLPQPPAQPNPVKNNIVGPYTKLPSASIEMLTNNSRNHVWNVSQDVDGDGFYASDDLDDDNDAVADGSDNCLVIENTNQTNTDSDGEGDACDSDDDNDNVADTSDAYPLISLGALTDNDDDGAPNFCDAACEAMGMIADSCIEISNPLQQDTDTPKDGYGNACDGDLNNDDIVDIEDMRILAEADLLSWVNTSVGKIPATNVPYFKPASEINPDHWYNWVKQSSYEPGDSGLSCAGVSTPCPAP